MGYAVGAVCYPTIQQAATAHCSSVIGTSAAGVTTCSGVTWVEEFAPEFGTVTYALRTVPLTGWEPGNSYDSVVAHAQLTYCDPDEPYVDMVEVWGLALVACTLVWVAKTFLYKLVSNQ